MSITKTTGTQFAIGTTYGTQFTITAITNASPAVATLSASHGVTVGDFIEITSGWDLANKRVFRASAVATNDVTLEGFNTTDTNLFPTGSGIGTGREITAWTSITQVTPDFSPSGGDQNYANITTVADQIQKQIPTDRNPFAVSIPLFFDPAASWFSSVQTASASGSLYAFRMIFPNSSRLVASAYWSLRGIPTNQDSTLRDQIDLTFAALPTVYAT